jgi:hypothetical protein
MLRDLSPSRRFFVVVAALATASCVSYLQQYVAFGKATLYPSSVKAAVGEVVPFEVRPPVPLESVWSLTCRGRVRFAEHPDESTIDWVASPHAVRLETVVSPWDPAPHETHTSQSWLWYSLRAEGEASPVERDLPLTREPYRELAPVTFAAAYAPGALKPEITVGERTGRAFVRYRTPTVKGIPHAPAVDAMLLETRGHSILYAEVRANFGEVEQEPVGYEVTLSYDPARAHAPVDIVVVGWMGQGDYAKPFTVTRYPPREEPSAKR